MRKGGEGRFCVNCPDYLRLTRKNACRGKIQGFDVIDCWHVGRHLLGWIQSAAAFVSSRGGWVWGFQPLSLILRFVNINTTTASPCFASSQLSPPAKLFIPLHNYISPFCPCIASSSLPSLSSNTSSKYPLTTTIASTHRFR